MLGMPPAYEVRAAHDHPKGVPLPFCRMGANRAIIDSNQEMPGYKK